MNRILVAVDFNKASISAYHYALNLALEMKAEVAIINVVNSSFSTVDSMFLDSMDAIYEAAEERLTNFVMENTLEIASISDLSIKKEVRFGVPGFTIVDFANDQQFDYVICGMRDNHDFIEKVLGTTSAIVARLVSCPVILIHENTPWLRPEKVIFTLDDSADFDESIIKFIKFNKYFNASTDFVHVRLDGVNIQNTKNAIIKEMFAKEEPSFNFEIKTIYGGDIVQSIVDYSIFEKADMLVMVHRKRSFIDSFFNRSLSLKTAEGVHLPVMVLEENLFRKRNLISN